MTVRFMEDTPYAESEREMQRVPGFRSRGRGLVVSHYEVETDGRKLGVCGPFEELLALFAMEVAESPFVRRVSRVSAKNREVFPMAGHQSRFECLWKKREEKKDRNAMCAAIYLLSADRFLWGRSAMAVQAENIQFQKIQIHGVDRNGYVLFHTAKDLYHGTNRLSLSELTNPEIINDDLFHLLMTAFLIRRHGERVLTAERRSTC